MPARTFNGPEEPEWEEFDRRARMRRTNRSTVLSKFIRRYNKPRPGEPPLDDPPKE